MASAQVYRFQRRVTNLQAHHELASKRHLGASKTYEDHSRTMMDSLITHLAENDKKLKKTKRISKPRATLSQGLRSTRPSEIVRSIDRFPSYSDFPGYGPALDDPCTSYNPFPSQFTVPEPKDDNFDYSVLHPVASSSMSSKEPIFPPPTYADPTTSELLLAQHSSMESRSCDDYANIKSGFTREFSGSNQAMNCGFQRYNCFHSSQSRELGYRRTEDNAYCTDLTFHDDQVSQSQNFSSNCHNLSTAPWLTSSVRPLGPPVNYNDSFFHHLDPSTSMSHCKYPDSYGQFMSKPPQDARDYPRTGRSDNPTVTPRVASSSSYAGINPILASTYPIASGCRSNKALGSFAQLSDSSATLGQGVQSNYRTLGFNTNHVQLADRSSFNDLHYL